MTIYLSIDIKLSLQPIGHVSIYNAFVSERHTTIEAQYLPRHLCCLR